MDRPESTKDNAVRLLLHTHRQRGTSRTICLTTLHRRLANMYIQMLLMSNCPLSAFLMGEYRQGRLEDLEFPIFRRLHKVSHIQKTPYLALQDHRYISTPGSRCRLVLVVVEIVIQIVVRKKRIGLDFVEKIGYVRIVFEVVIIEITIVVRVKFKGEMG
ncbi:hypothetical protein Tco_0997760 [Tanacetum coccineum]